MIFSLFSVGSVSIAFALLIGYLCALLIGFCGHEYCHALSAYKQGDPTPKVMKRLTINPLAHFDVLGLIMLLMIGFGYGKPVPINPYNFKHGRKSTFLVSSAGILFNFGCAILFALIFSCVDTFAPTFFDGNSFGTWLVYSFLFYGIFVNVMLALFNLLPIAPLDGFKMVECCTKPNNSFVEHMEKFGQYYLIAVLIMFTFGYNFLSIFANMIVSGLGKLFDMFWRLFL